MSSTISHHASERPPRPVTVVVAIEVRLYREAIVRTLAGSPKLRFAGEASSAHQLTTLARACHPDVALVDVGMVDALAAVRHMTEHEPLTRVLAIGLPRREEDVVAAAELGVAGFISADHSLGSLVSAVEMVMNGEAPCSGRIAAALLRRVAATAFVGTRDAGLGELTAREREILELVDEGLSNKEIARRLTIGLTTVKSHVHTILRKLGVERRGAAAARLHSVR